MGPERLTQPEKPNTDSGTEDRGLRGVLRPVRRFFAKFALVREEVGRAVDDVRKENAASEARLLPEMEQMRAEVRRVQRENAAIVRLIAGPGQGEGATSDVLGGVAEEAVAVEAGSANPAI